MRRVRKSRQKEADPSLPRSAQTLHDSMAGTDAGPAENNAMNQHPTSTEMGWGRGTAPLPRTHPQEQDLVVYTNVWTHLFLNNRVPVYSTRGSRPRSFSKASKSDAPGLKNAHQIIFYLYRK